MQDFLFLSEIHRQNLMLIPALARGRPGAPAIRFQAKMPDLEGPGIALCEDPEQRGGTSPSPLPYANRYLLIHINHMPIHFSGVAAAAPHHGRTRAGRLGAAAPAQTEMRHRLMQRHGPLA